MEQACRSRAARAQAFASPPLLTWATAAALCVPAARAGAHDSVAPAQRVYEGVDTRGTATVHSRATGAARRERRDRSLAREGGRPKQEASSWYCTVCTASSSCCSASGPIVDGWRITQQAREGANFDAIGPDRYLMALGALMLLAGLWRLLRGPEPQTETAAAVPDRDAGARSSLLVTVALLVGFALLVPVLGFSPTCFLFLTVLLRVLGGWTWWRSLALPRRSRSHFTWPSSGSPICRCPKGISGSETSPKTWEKRQCR